MSLDKSWRLSDFFRTGPDEVRRGGAVAARGRNVPRGGFTGLDAFGFLGAFTLRDELEAAPRRVAVDACESGV